MSRTAATQRLPGKRERNKAANRAAILEAGQRCFIENNYDAITVRDIIRRTTLATGTFYNYFRDKREVFDALLSVRMRELTEQLVRIRRNATTLHDFVHGAYLAAFETIAEDPLFYEVIMRNAAIVQELYDDRIMGLSVKALEDDIRDGIRRGLIPAVDVEYLAAAFFGVASEIGKRLARREDRDPRPAADLATRLFMQGLSTQREVDLVPA